MGVTPWRTRSGRRYVQWRSRAAGVQIGLPEEGCREGRTWEDPTTGRRWRRSGPSCGRGWRTTSLPRSPRRASGPPRSAPSSSCAAWNRTLADGGWAAPAWPAEYGGRDAGVAEQLVYLEEMSRARAPGPVNQIGVSNIAPAIMQFGTDEQKARFLDSDAARRRDLVAGHVRAGRRFRPGCAAHRRHRRRRRLRHQRTEDLELHGALRRLVPALRPHRSNGQEARRHHVLSGGYAHAGYRGATAHHDDRESDLRGALLQRCRVSRVRPCWVRCIKGGRWPSRR